MITCYSSSDRVADSMGPDHSNNSCKDLGLHCLLVCSSYNGKKSQYRIIAMDMEE